MKKANAQRGPASITNDERLLEALNRIARMLAVGLTNGLKQREQIGVLTRAGLKPKEIADILGTSSNTVRVELVALRKSAKKRRR
jgi:DNA-binding NarL/FixJ family response regulator